MPERPKFDSQTLKRLLSYMRAYKGTLVLVTVCILLSAVAGAASSMFLQKLIDGYIVPMLGTASPDYSGLIRALITIGCVYLVGTLATWLYNRRMVTIAQGTLKRIRDEMFEKMQSLPIRYFDTHTHGETVVLLSHKKPDGHINVNVEFGEGEGKVPLDNIAKRAEEYKPKERVTYKMIKEYIEAKYGFKVHTAYIAEVKRDLGLPMYDAPNAVEELKQPRKHPTAEKVEAIKDALKHFEVI